VEWMTITVYTFFSCLSIYIIPDYPARMQRKIAEIGIYER
jgi:hypothetical protein